jgi:TRAP-type C4-dicarboxylate transport system substrate-binding protein
MNFRRNLISSAAAVLLSFTLIPVASAQTVLRASDVHPAGYPNVVAVENMGKKLESATAGRYKLQMFPGGVLGSEKEVVEQTQIGAIQIARISLGILGPVVPDVNVFNMPFVFRDEAHMRAVIDGPVGKEFWTRSPTALHVWWRWVGWTAAHAVSTPRRKSSRLPTSRASRSV